MSVAVSASVAVVTAKAAIRLTFTATGGNFVRVWCTAAPPGSKLRGKLDKDRLTQTLFVDADSGAAIDYTFDVSGAYQLSATEMTKGAAPYGGGHQGAPDAERTETILGSTALTFYVASAIKSTLGHGQDTADLLLYVAGDSIRETTFSVHGKATPAVENARTDKATTAAEGAAVAIALADLVDTSATDALGDLGVVATGIIDTFNAHIVDASFHNDPDVANEVLDGFRNPTSPEALKRSVSAILKALSSHIRNDNVVTPAGTGSEDWHYVGSLGVVDWPAIPLFESSATVADHVRALADAWRSFEAHRSSADAHGAPDTTHTLTALPPLLNVHRLFLTELASLSPTVPITENSAKTILVHGAGFEES